MREWCQGYVKLGPGRRLWMFSNVAILAGMYCSFWGPTLRDWRRTCTRPIPMISQFLSHANHNPNGLTTPKVLQIIRPHTRATSHPQNRLSPTYLRLSRSTSLRAYPHTRDPPHLTSLPPPQHAPIDRLILMMNRKYDRNIPIGRVGRDLVKDGIWSSSSTVLVISLLERPSSRTRSGLSDRPLMSTDGRDGQD